MRSEKREKSLVGPVERKGGGNKEGRLSVGDEGGGEKGEQGMMEFKGDKEGIGGGVGTMEYDRKG